MSNHTAILSFPEKVSVAVSSTLVSICCVGGNLLVLIAFCLDRGVQNSNNHFIISLAVTDLTIGLISVNLLTLYTLLGYWPLGNFVCDCWLAIDFTACWVSQVTVLMITLDRFMSVRFAVKYRNWRTANKLKTMLALSWILPASLWIPMVFAWYALTGEIRPPEHLCNVPFTHHTSFNTILTVAYFWIPLCFMISLYVGIYRVAAGLQKRASASSRGLTDLVVMAGATMSRIGLSVKVKTDGGYNVERLGAVPTAIYRVKDKKSETALRVETNEDETANGTDTYVRLLPETPTDFMDSGLGESNNHRATLDFSCNHKRRPSQMSLDHPEFSDVYKCIISPNAPSSTTSSLNFEADNDPWTRRTDSQIVLSYAKFEKRASHQTDSTPNSNSGDNQRKIQHRMVGQYARASPIHFNCFSGSILGGQKTAHPDTSKICKSIKCSAESAKTTEMSPRSLESSPDNQPVLRTWHDRFMRFQSLKQSETRNAEVRKSKRARKALRMITFILGAFVICWTPYHVIIIVKGFCDRPGTADSCINGQLYTFAYYMCYMNSPINPFCYAMANVTFRRAFFRILKGDFRVK